MEPNGSNRFRLRFRRHYHPHLGPVIMVLRYRGLRRLGPDFRASGSRARPFLKRQVGTPWAPESGQILGVNLISLSCPARNGFWGSNGQLAGRHPLLLRTPLLFVVITPPSLFVIFTPPSLMRGLRCPTLCCRDSEATQLIKKLP